MDKALLRKNNKKEPINKAQKLRVLALLWGDKRGASTRRTTQGMTMSGVAMFKRTLKKESLEITKISNILFGTIINFRHN